MTAATFKLSTNSNEPPFNISVYLNALWYDAKGDWEKAHTIIQDIEDKDAAWIHAYLHRKEGDNWNADYWYRRAGKTRPATDLDTEWANIVNAFL
jgi:Tfp pilus assembly protein PilF